MATVVFDNATYNNTTSFSHTTSSGLYRGMVIFNRHTGSGNYSSYTYNGVSATRVLSNLQIGLSGQYITTFYLNAPASGSNTIAVTGGTLLGSAVLTYTGVKQSGQPASDSAGSGQGIGSSPSTNITTVTNESWVVVALAASTTPTGVTSWTIRGTNNTTFSVGDSNASVTAGSNTYGATLSGAENTGMSAIELESLAPFTTTVSDTVITTDSQSYAVGITPTDTNVTTDTQNSREGWGNQTKNVSTWTNQAKS